MILKRNQVFKMVLRSLWRNPKDWEINSHGSEVKFWTTIYDISNQELDIKIWTANGMPFFELNKMTSNHSWYGDKVKLNILQSTILHIVYLRKIRNYSYLAILIRYLLVGCLTSFTGILVCYITNFNNKKEVDLNLSKVEYRNSVINEILN